MTLVLISFGGPGYITRGDLATAMLSCGQRHRRRSTVTDASLRAEGIASHSAAATAAVRVELT